jgi:enoyl-CoA hydratase/carnithine racemase
MGSMGASSDEILAEVRGHVGFITLNRPRALNALSLAMIRAITARLLTWRDDPQVKAVAMRGMGKSGPFGVFCAGGDIRFFHQAVLTGNPALEDFFTEEYALNHLIHTYPKPTVAFMDGIVMGGGMGISQGAHLRIVTERTKMAMPETHIGLFPDVGGGYFLSRCPGRVGEWLALTGEPIGADAAVAFGLADTCMESARLPDAWDALAQLAWDGTSPIAAWLAIYSIASGAYLTGAEADIDHYFSLQSVPEIIEALEAGGRDWTTHTAAALRKHSPLMLHVTLAQIRRARDMTLSDDLRMERDLVRHCFSLRPGTASETFEGIRALAVDKDHSPKWNPGRIEDVTADMVAPFFQSPWPAHAHPLQHLS